MAKRRCENAVPERPGTLAWLDDAQQRTPVGVNPAHVAVLSAVKLAPES